VLDKRISQGRALQRHFSQERVLRRHDLAGRMSAEKKAYPLRISADVLDAVQRWANDELRSANAQIEYVLRDALRKAGRLKAEESRAPGAPGAKK